MAQALDLSQIFVSVVTSSSGINDVFLDGTFVKRFESEMVLTNQFICR